MRPCTVHYGLRACFKTMLDTRLFISPFKLYSILTKIKIHKDKA